MAPGQRTELSVRSDGRDLPARAGALRHEPLLDADAPAAAWRIVEVFSLTGLPFEVGLAWSAGGGVGAEAQLTVSRAARVCVYARGLRVRAANLSAGVNRVGVTVADAAAPTENQWEATGETTDQLLEAEVPVPSFARRVRLELADAALLPTALLRLYDGAGTLRSTVRGDAQPPEGVPVGGARALHVLTTGATAWRAVFTLSL